MSRTYLKTLVVFLFPLALAAIATDTVRAFGLFSLGLVVLGGAWVLHRRRHDSAA